MTESTAPAPHHLRRDEILDWQTYADEREAMRSEVMAIKASRRIHMGEHLTFLFENHDTMRYQVQEIMRAERIVRESSIRGSWTPTTPCSAAPASWVAPC
ncbi:MAG: hypothetical protein Ct9H300mP12_12370 [Acidimicrobiales bacterium]|nr:MAG: hypothetical protein Ct9H300mP12_12370 [Acidimicrobiales bacterium]